MVALSDRTNGNFRVVALTLSVAAGFPRLISPQQESPNRFRRCIHPAADLLRFKPHATAAVGEYAFASPVGDRSPADVDTQECGGFFARNPLFVKRWNLTSAS
jgi:hypothetical protein